MPPSHLYYWAIPLIAGGVVVRYIIQNVAIPAFWSPIANVPGPIPNSFWGSNLLPLFDSKKSWEVHERFVQRYGRTLRVFGFAKFDQRILTLDPAVITYILNRPGAYQKPWQSRALISAIVGESLFSAEGGKHRRQRRIADPAFSDRNLPSFLPIFFSKAAQLSERWISIIENSEERKTVIDVSGWVNRLTLDVIGEVGFGVNFNALNDESNELYVAYKELSHVLLKKQHPFWTFLGIWIPKVRPWLRTDMFMSLNRCRSVVDSFGMKLLDEKRKLLNDKEKCSKQKDLLTTFLKANAIAEQANEQKITDSELLDIVNTILNAGSDTTGLGIIWALHFLSINPEVQARLREEVSRVPIYSPSQVSCQEEFEALFRAIDDLPYLDAVLKETLRLNPAVHSTVRVAMTDDEIPLSQEMKMRDGSTNNVFRVKKGQWIHIPFEACNIDKAVWGEDAWEFKPERWECLPEAVSTLPGAYCNLLSFSAGPRVCIGMRFAVMEAKIVIHHIISCLTLAPTANIVKGTVAFSRPYIEDDWRKGRSSSCPLSMTRYIPDEAACI